MEKTLKVGRDKWRRILKTLFLVEHMLRVGNSKFVSSINNFSHIIKDLTDFRYIDEKKDEKGGSSKHFIIKYVKSEKRQIL